ncbi:MAG: nucleotide exchange factor GrpE [Sinomicrobium sp.]|nr:nucleotide exchange factor GrpE [Sinomicrobium sp.]
MSKKKKDKKTEEDNVMVSHETGENPEESKTGAEDVEAELSVEAQLREELSAEKDKFLRLFAEFENYKKRVAKERIELFKTAGQEVMMSMLPVLDDFDRAMAMLSGSEDKEMLKGIELINHKFIEVLRSKGLEEITVTRGDVFDAEHHDAITQIPAPEEALKGKIIDITEKGYKLGERVIRYPKVVVGH